MDFFYRVKELFGLLIKNCVQLGPSPIAQPKNYERGPGYCRDLIFGMNALLNQLEGKSLYKTCHGMQ